MVCPREREIFPFLLNIFLVSCLAPVKHKELFPYLLIKLLDNCFLLLYFFQRSKEGNIRTTNFQQRWRDIECLIRTRLEFPLFFLTKFNQFMKKEAKFYCVALFSPYKVMTRKSHKHIRQIMRYELLKTVEVTSFQRRRTTSNGGRCRKKWGKRINLSRCVNQIWFLSTQKFFKLKFSCPHNWYFVRLEQTRERRQTRTSN